MLPSTGGCRLAVCALLALLLVTLAACEPSEPTQVIVIVEADPLISARASHTTLVVTGDPSGLPREAFNSQGRPRPAQFPYVIELRPRDNDPSASYRLEVSALELTQPIAVARLLSGYVAGETRYVRLRLEDSCLGVTCTSDETCSLGRCIDARVPAAEFGANRASAPPSSALASWIDASVPDLTREAGADTGPAVDAAEPDASSADAGPQPPSDAGLDGGMPVPDGGPMPLVCAPKGPWTFTFTEHSDSCGIDLMPVTVNYSGTLATLVDNPDCSEDVTPIGEGGCAIYYEQDCDTPDEEVVAFEIGMLQMTAPDRIVGSAQVLWMNYLTGRSCSANLSAVGTPGASGKVQSGGSTAGGSLTPAFRLDMSTLAPSSR